MRVKPVHCSGGPTSPSRSSLARGPSSTSIGISQTDWRRLLGPSLARALRPRPHSRLRPLCPGALALIASTPNDEYPEPAISRFFLSTGGAAALWFVVRMNVGAQWFLAGWEKVQDPAWGTSGTALKGFVAGALAKSSGAHPSVQGWYASFLQNFVQPNAGLWSFLITWGEVAVGLGLLVGALTGIAAGFGVLMNLNYLLAGTVSINPVLGIMGLFLVLAWRVAGLIGLIAGCCRCWACHGNQGRLLPPRRGMRQVESTGS